MTEYNAAEYRIKRLFGRLSTLREDSQEDNQDIIIEQDQSDTSEYDIIEPIEGIFILKYFTCSLIIYSVRAHYMHNCSSDNSE
jgi:hypothetical protein